jgi:uncharacterized membrane protein
LFYVLSFVVPIAGVVIGVIYFTKTDEDLKRFGKTCFIIAAILSAFSSVASAIAAGASILLTPVV